MNQAFREFVDLPEQDRRDVFEAAAEKLDVLPTYIEKDFWVCLTLDLLYNGLSGDHHRLLFKGGTSLSKAYGLIQRFSEDVDFTVFREDLGFGEEQDPASPKLSGKRRQRLSEQIQQETSSYICGQLQEELHQAALGVSLECKVEVDENDQDKSTLLFLYPSLFEDNDYVQPRVRLEGGGRSALDPHEDKSIQPYINKTLEDWDFTVSNVITIHPKRTFWDKVLILHGWHCGYRDQRRLPQDRQRLSRHYYDVAMIAKTDTGQLAISDVALQDNVREYTRLLFNRSWMKLDEAIPGKIQLLPVNELETLLRTDYQAMQGMMLGTAPEFDGILRELRKLEAMINRL